MTEKELEEIVYTNVDFTKLDAEHVYVFRIRKDYIAAASVEDIDLVAKNLSEKLQMLGIKFIIVVGDMFEITELVR